MSNIPDKIKSKIEDMAMKESSSPSDYEYLKKYYEYGYSLASEQIQEKDKQIESLTNAKLKFNDTVMAYESKLAKLREFIQKAANANVGRPSELVSQFEKYQEKAKKLLSETK